MYCLGGIDPNRKKSANGAEKWGHLATLQWIFLPWNFLISVGPSARADKKPHRFSASLVNEGFTTFGCYLWLRKVWPKNVGLLGLPFFLSVWHSYCLLGNRI